MHGALLREAPGAWAGCWLLAEGLLARGARVALLDIDADALEATRAAREPGGHVVSRVCDMCDADDIYAAAEWAREGLGGMDILINNAGVVSGGALVDVSEEEHTRTWLVNSLGVARMTRAVLPGMIEQQRGHVVNMASASGLTGLALGTTYSGSKSAVVG
ncbi:MAG: all-trans-retinol dehydrogenase (NAD+) [Myxococcota bacterium]